MDSVSNVTYSTIKYRMTTFSKVALVAIVLAVLCSFLVSIPLTYGFIVILVVIAVVDAFESRRVLLSRELQVSCDLAQAASPEVLTFSLSALPGAAGMKVAPIRFGTTDFENLRAFTIEAREQRIRTVMMAAGRTALARAFVRFELSVSVIGLVEVRRMALFAPRQTMGRTPGFGTMNENVLPIAIDEIGRLRKYVPGDRRSRVSWTTTARTGTLHVRDSQVEEYGDVDVMLDFDSANPAQVVGWAGAVVGNLLEQGINVQLHTIELAPSFYREELEVQLADLWAPIPPLTRVHPYVVVVGLVTTREELVRRLSLAQAGAVPRPSGPHIEVGHFGMKRVI